MTVKRSIYSLYIILFFCIVQATGMSVYAQQPDSLQVDSLVIDNLLVDSIPTEVYLLADSLAKVNKENLEKLEETAVPEMTLLSADKITIVPEKKIWMPNSTKATWLAVVFPGGGQIYNRKYWKLPIIYGGFAGCAYALSWNNKMFTDYSQAYRDILDGDPMTNSYYDIIGTNVVIDEKTDSRYGPLLRRNRDFYRRYRDISVFAFIGVYLISIIDAYVDAELSNFDITPDLSMRIEPAVLTNPLYSSSRAVGMQCSFRF